MLLKVVVQVERINQPLKRLHFFTATKFKVFSNQQGVVLSELAIKYTLSG